MSYLRTNYRLTGPYLESETLQSAFITTIVSFTAAQGSYYTAIENLLGFKASVRVLNAVYALDDAGDNSHGYIDFHVSTSYATGAESVILYFNGRMIHPAGTGTFSTAMNPICTTSIGIRGGATSDVALRVDLLVVSAAEAYA